MGSCVYCLVLCVCNFRLCIMLNVNVGSVHHTVCIIMTVIEILILFNKTR